MSEIPENAVEKFKAEWHRADAEGDVGNRVARGLGAAVGEELRRLRRELEGLRAGQLRSVLVEEGRDPDAAPMSGEDVRYALSFESERERLARVIHEATEAYATSRSGCDPVPWDEASEDACGEAFAAADAVLAERGEVSRPGPIDQNKPETFHAPLEAAAAVILANAIANVQGAYQEAFKRFEKDTSDKRAFTRMDTLAAVLSALQSGEPIDLWPGEG